jgi:hypothetical protein
LSPCGDGLEHSVAGDAVEGGGDMLDDSVSIVVLIASGFRTEECPTSGLDFALCAAVALRIDFMSKDMSECEIWMQEKLLIKMMQKNNTHLFFHYLLQRSRFN